MELIYIRTLEVSAPALSALVCILLAELACVFIIDRVSHTTMKYASSVLAIDGYYLNNTGFHGCNEHRVKRCCYIVPVILYSLLLVSSCACVAIPLRTLVYDKIQYVYIYTLVCSTVLGQFVIAVRKVNRARTHFERLKLIDICRILGDPTQSILLFTDRHGWLYEYITSDPTAWSLHDFFDATCYGELIVELDTTPKPQKFFGYQVLHTHLMCMSSLAPVTLVVIGTLLCIIDLPTGAIPICLSAFFLGRRKERKVYVCGRRFTVEYTDISYACKYVFACVDKKSNTFYYTTDDDRALDIGCCYDCVVKSGVIEMVMQKSERQVIYYHQKQQNISTVIAFCLMLFITVFVCHVLGYILIAYAIEFLGFIILGKSISYTGRGDV